MSLIKLLANDVFSYDHSGEIRISFSLDSAKKLLKISSENELTKKENKKLKLQIGLLELDKNTLKTNISDINKYWELEIKKAKINEKRFKIALGLTVSGGVTINILSTASIAYLLANSLLNKI